VDASDRQLPARVREILQHYLANPQTADSLEGIAEWRLIDDFVRQRAEETRRAVEWLVERGLLVRTVGGAIPPVYRLNQSAVADAERLIRDLGSPSSETKRET
jgi:hypothetical protein